MEILTCLVIVMRTMTLRFGIEELGLLHPSGLFRVIVVVLVPRGRHQVPLHPAERQEAAARAEEIAEARQGRSCWRLRVQVFSLGVLERQRRQQIGSCGRALVVLEEDFRQLRLFFVFVRRSWVRFVRCIEEADVNNRVIVRHARRGDGGPGRQDERARRPTKSR